MRSLPFIMEADDRTSMKISFFYRINKNEYYIDIEKFNFGLII